MQDMSCSAVAPLMRAMECIPEDENGENENPLVTSIKSLNRGSMNIKSDATDQLKKLKTRLEDFWSKGWLSKKEYQQHLDFLSTFDVSCIGSNGKYALKELEREFDTVERKKSTPAPQSWSDMFMSTLGVSTAKTNRASSSSGLSSFWSNSMAMSNSFNESEEDSSVESPKALATSTNRTANGARNPTIVSPKNLSNTLSEHAVSDLFVETCFFARLGFVQPPCCMSCTYKEALKGNIPNMDCENWVIWRKNANRSFDPSNNANISDNALVVQCRSARKLSTGKMVDGYQWDSHQKMLLRRRLS